MQKVLSEGVQCPSNYQGLAESPHSHPPNTDENIADQLATSIKRKAEEHPKWPSAQLLWAELQIVPDEVLSQLPSQPVLVKSHAKNSSKRGPSCSHKTMVSQGNT